MDVNFELIEKYKRDVLEWANQRDHARYAAQLAKEGIEWKPLPITNLETLDYKKYALWPAYMVPSVLANFYPHHIGLPSGSEWWKGLFWYDLSEVWRNPDGAKAQVYKKCVPPEDRLWADGTFPTVEPINENSTYCPQRKQYITHGLASYQAAAVQMCLLDAMVEVAIEKKELVVTKQRIIAKDVIEWVIKNQCIAEAMKPCTSLIEDEQGNINPLEHNLKWQKLANAEVEKMKKEGIKVRNREEVVMRIISYTAKDCDIDLNDPGQ